MVWKKRDKGRGKQSGGGRCDRGNKGRGGDDVEAEAGKRAAENEDKKAKKTCQRKERDRNES